MLNGFARHPGRYGQPWHLLLFMIAGWVHRRQQDVVECLRTENQGLKEKLGNRRILSDDQRCRLAVKGKALGRKALEEITTIATPDTFLRQHRELAARESGTTAGSAGKPGVRCCQRRRSLDGPWKFPAWGWDRIQGAFANLGHKISGSTAADILRRDGIEPAPERKRQTAWHTFLKAHGDVPASVDFTALRFGPQTG